MDLRNENASIHSETAGASEASGANVSAAFKDSLEFDHEPVLTPPCTDETIRAEIQSIYCTSESLGLHSETAAERLLSPWRTAGGP